MKDGNISQVGMIELTKTCVLSPEANILPEPRDTIPASLKPYFFKNKQPPSLLYNYDAIGFSVDHSLVKYNV